MSVTVDTAEDTADARWEVVRDKVYSVSDENLSPEKKAAAYKQLLKQDLKIVERLLNVRSQKDLIVVLRNELPAEAAAGGTGAAGATVTLKFEDSGGVQQLIPACLHRGRLNKDVLTDLLSSMKLSLLMVNGAAPNYDQDGYTTQIFQPGEVVELTTIMRPEDAARDAALNESLLARLWAKKHLKVTVAVAISVAVITLAAGLGSAAITSHNRAAPVPPPPAPPVSTTGNAAEAINSHSRAAPPHSPISTSRNTAATVNRQNRVAPPPAPVSTARNTALNSGASVSENVTGAGRQSVSNKKSTGESTPHGP